MSQSTVIASVKACLEDGVFGLATKVAIVAPVVLANSVVTLDQIQTEFQFVDARPPRTITPATLPAIGIRAVKWDARHRYANLRDGQLDVEIRVEHFGVDLLVAQTNIDIYADALALVLDGLRAYNDAQTPVGPVIDVLAVDDVMLSVVNGLFDDPASTGFLATFRVQERTIYG